MAQKCRAMLRLGYPWRCVECFEGIFFAGDFPTVKLNTADDLGPCSRCGCDLNAGGAWIFLWEHDGESSPLTALYVTGDGARGGCSTP